ncbi:MAG: BON domain-containing protein [Bacteroidetes bacterium]|jgi:osmotically-inducible protein OsmY|nr:BON domain-containing protein [Bacteroidota bacterium]
MKTDSEIQEDVMAELKWEPMLNATEIGIAVKDGVVTLTGTVSNYSKKFAAENATWRVKGVKAVAEELEVKLADGDLLTDSEIASSVINTLRWNTVIPDEQVKIKVSNGWVYLSGEVDWNFQKDAVMNAIRGLKGVRGVANEITVKPRVQPADIKENIKKALERKADLEADNIRVETIGDHVVLKGSAKSWNERKTIAHAAWSTPGVALVEDKIVISY